LSYFGFLARFLLIPIGFLVLLLGIDQRHIRALAPDQKRRQGSLLDWRGWAAVGLHAVIAVAYTTPWDNYLVATKVWWYEPELVTGVTLGWVPLEEYTFFVLQTLMVGLSVLWLARRLIPSAKGFHNPSSRLRIWASMLFLAAWVLALFILFSGWQPGTYLALELVWALPPIGLQIAFGADILYRYWRLVALTLVPFTLYLSFADTLAIQSGTWTIDPQQSLGFLIQDRLPVEEFLFFLLTNALVVFGVTLILAPESVARWRKITQRLFFSHGPKKPHLTP
jgi:lycopene cyclase domain-containing protein